MIVYRVAHYFFCLFLIISTILYFMRGSVSAALGLDHIFSQIDALYESLPTVADEEVSLEDFQDKMSGLFLEIETIVQSVRSDIGFPTAIRALEIRNVNDIEYLVYEHLVRFTYFKDLLVYKDHELIYKYNKTNTYTPIVLEYREDKDMRIEFHFHENVIYSLLNKLSTPVFMKDGKGYIYFPKFYISENKDISRAIREQKTDRIDFKDKNLYKITVTSNFKNPIELYGLYDKKKTHFSLLQFFFIALWPLFCMFCLGCHFVIYRKLSAISNKPSESMFSNFRSLVHKYFYKDHQESEESIEEEELNKTLDWIDSFIGAADNSNSGMSSKKSD